MNCFFKICSIIPFCLFQSQINNINQHSGDQRGWQVLVVTFLSSFLAQLIKVFTNLIKNRKLDLRLIATTGGMPSSHSCCMVGMATSVGLIEGFNSITFAIALAMAAIVMYDAAGVRRTVGLQAKVLNKMIEELFSEHPHISSERIKEFLGHTPKEVLAGAALGILIAYGFNWSCGLPFQPQGY